MDRDRFWMLVAQARADVGETAGVEAVAERCAVLLAQRPAQEIRAAAQVLWDLLADSYRQDLWAAGYLLNGGCSDDGFEYFRGWLIAQGRETFERVVADPDSLADLPVVIGAARDGMDLDCEDMLAVAWRAYRAATGEDLPPDSFTIGYPPLDDGWDFDDAPLMRHHLPRLFEMC